MKNKTSISNNNSKNHESSCSSRTEQLADSKDQSLDHNVTSSSANDGDKTKKIRMICKFLGEEPIGKLLFIGNLRVSKNRR